MRNSPRKAQADYARIRHWIRLVQVSGYSPQDAADELGLNMDLLRTVRHCRPEIDAILMVSEAELEQRREAALAKATSTRDMQQEFAHQLWQTKLFPAILTLADMANPFTEEGQWAMKFVNQFSVVKNAIPKDSTKTVTHEDKQTLTLEVLQKKNAQLDEQINLLLEEEQEAERVRRERAILVDYEPAATGATEPEGGSPEGDTQTEEPQ